MKVYNTSGDVVEIDSVPVSTGGGVNEWTEYILDFGTTPVYDKDFTITDGSVTVNSKIAVSMDLVDEGWQWDVCLFTVTPGSGSFSLNCNFEDGNGPVTGNRLIEYQVNN